MFLIVILVFTNLSDHFFFQGDNVFSPIRDVETGCLCPWVVESDGSDRGSGAAAAVAALSVVGGLLSGGRVHGIHAFRAVRGSICSDLSVVLLSMILLAA